MKRLWKGWFYFACGICVGFFAASYSQTTSFAASNCPHEMTALDIHAARTKEEKKSADRLLPLKEPRVLCWIMTHRNNTSTKGKAVEDTWGKRCDLLLFASDGEQSALNTVPIRMRMTPGREHLSNKTLLTFQYIYEQYIDDYDWFMKADDDTYVIMENLKYFLSAQHYEDAVYFGHLYNPWVNQGYFSGGAGYVISREALRRYGQRDSSLKQCQARYGHAEDVVFGQCMAALNVRTGESRDKYGRSRFHSMSLADHVTGNFAEWYYFYDGHKAQRGAESISKFPISFHYVKPREMYAFELLIYKLKVHRVNSEDVHIAVMNSTQS